MSLSLCSRCRLALRLPHQESLFFLPSAKPLTIHYTPRRFHSERLRKKNPEITTNISNNPSLRSRSNVGRTISARPGLIGPAVSQIATSPSLPPGLRQESLNASFSRLILPWANNADVHKRLRSFGIPWDQIRPLLVEYVHTVRSGYFLQDENFEKFGLSRLSESTRRDDLVCTNIFYAWASQPSVQSQLLQKNEQLADALDSISRLSQAADLSYIADRYPLARKMRRKFIMHVGPTNSGKTHNALRALAGAKSGVYAGPLRLLAHEIWERLNKGQIAPLDAEEDTATKSSESSGIPDLTIDIGDGKPMQLSDNLKYARPCNMLTGEEQKIVSEGAPLLSCTVEMISLTQHYNVAVVDEIQMIADPDRGGGWTQAVLGLRAEEIHLCGEETAVPLIRAMLEETGDELVVNRYERLSPLKVENESLKGDLTKVRKGDCVVTFSRSTIFALKNKIEQTTGLKCAVAYGKLPPEVRSEQAALFNDPNSGYDVMVGSDAIGMGLNLKIKRIILEATTKWDGSNEVSLSVSQIKQIAGRAGRYGLHEDDDSVGLATTLMPNDLPHLRKALAQSVPPLDHARIAITTESFKAISQQLPAGATTETIYDVHLCVSKMSPVYRFVEGISLGKVATMMDDFTSNFAVSDRIQMLLAPIPWRDQDGLDVVQKFIYMHENDMGVCIDDALGGTGYLDNLVWVESLMQKDRQPNTTSKHLDRLEGLHKIIVVYLWMSYRNPVVYHQYEHVVELKNRVEKALDWALKGMRPRLKGKQARSSPKHFADQSPYLKELLADLSENENGAKAESSNSFVQRPTKLPSTVSSIPYQSGFDRRLQRAQAQTQTVRRRTKDDTSFRSP